MRVVCTIIVILASLMASGCSRDGSNSSPASLPIVSTIPGQPESQTGALDGKTAGNANVSIAFIIPGQSGPSASIMPQTTGENPRISISLKLVNPAAGNQALTTLTKEVSVTDGTAQTTFSGIPAVSAAAEVNFIGAQKGGYTQFRGAVDLQSGANVLEVAPFGSGQVQDVVASAMIYLAETPDYTSDLKVGLVEKLKSAYQTAVGLVGVNSSRLVDNTREVYLAQEGTQGSSQTTNYLNSSKTFITSYSTYKDNAYQSRASGNIKAGIRSAVGAWSYDYVYEWWSIYHPGTDANTGTLYAFWFADALGNKYPYFDSSPVVEKLVTGTVSNFYYGFDLLQLIELYYLKPLGNYMVLVSGSSSISLKASNTKIIEIQARDVYGDIRMPYPLSGSIEVTVIGNGKATLYYNGTCVARVIVEFLDGSRESFRTLLG